MALLPKKGDLSRASNYRPIQLVNADNKIFTRIINERLMTVSSSLIKPYQLGFMPGRYIAGHGLLTQMMMENAVHNYSDDALNQRNTFFLSFIGSLKAVADTHSNLNLSILGRATIANVLILFKSWYTLSFTPVTKAILRSIQSIVSPFVSRGIFPRIS